MKIRISNNFAYFGYAEIIFDQNEIIEWDYTNLQYDNLAAVFVQISGGTGTRLEKPSGPYVYDWNTIIENAAKYIAIGDKNDAEFGTYRGNPQQDEWAEFHKAPIVTIIEN